jgi:sterol desaturase/sphingolipid hydroxylase (fatty acid hydroxylase superfamily)
LDPYLLLVAVIKAIAGLAVVVLIGVLFELFAPVSCSQSFRAWVFKFKLLVVFTAISTILVALVTPLVRAVATSFGGGWFRLSLGEGYAAQLTQVVLAIFIFDFFYYWLHRLQHRSWFLWQEHKLHHADQHLDVITAGLHHWLEALLRALFISVPIAITFDIPPTTVALSSALVGLWGGLKHLNFRLSLGPLTPVLVGPQLHRIHHSVMPEHRDRNFAAFFPIYDLLFGTYCAPRTGEWPNTGLPDRDWPRSLGQAAIWPLRPWWSASVTWCRAFRTGWRLLLKTKTPPEK